MFPIKDGVVEIRTAGGFLAKLKAGDIFGEMFFL
jgi:hypothetical protein